MNLLHPAKFEVELNVINHDYLSSPKITYTFDWSFCSGVNVLNTQLTNHSSGDVSSCLLHIVCQLHTPAVYIDHPLN